MDISSYRKLTLYIDKIIIILFIYIFISIDNKWYKIKKTILNRDMNLLVKDKYNYNSARGTSKNKKWSCAYTISKY